MEGAFPAVGGFFMFAGGDAGVEDDGVNPGEFTVHALGEGFDARVGEHVHLPNFDAILFRGGGG